MRVLIFEGTPEEMLRIPMFREALRPQADGPGQVAIPGNATNGEPRDVSVQALLEKAPPRVVNFVKRVQSWPSVQVERGASVKLADGMTRYLRFSRADRTFGYLHPTPQGARIELRLPKKAAGDAQHARARNVKGTNPYQVRVYLSNDAAVEEAVGLAEVAYNAVK